jgi:hypothetical protein
MATKRQVFKGINAQYFSPTVSLGQEQQVQASSYGNLAQNIDRTLRFAIGKVEKESEIAAYEYAASNPLTVSQYLNADPTERSKLLPKGTNKYKSVLRNAQVNFMATDMAMSASKDISDLEMEATTYEMPSEQFEERLNAIVNGYTKAFLDIDAEGAITVKAKLATMAHSSYNSYLSNSIKRAKEIKTSVVKNYAQESINEIAKDVNGYMGKIKIYHDYGDREETISLDDHLKQKKQIKMNELIIKGYKDIDTWSTKWDAEVIKQKQNVLSTYYDTPDVQETATQAMDMYDEAEKGTFGGNTDLQEIYTSLPQNEKEAYLEKVEEWSKGVRTNIEEKEKARVTDANGIIKNTRVNYYEAKLAGDYTAAKQHLDAMKNVDKTEYEKLLIDFDTSIDDGAFTDAKEYDRLETLLIRGQLTDQDVDEVYATRKITSKQRSEFKLAIDKRKTATFSKADAYIKKAIGYEDTRISIGDSDEKSIAFEEYRQKSNELYDYMFNNPGISSADLMNKAMEIVSVKTEDNNIKAKILKIRTKLTSDQKAYGGFSTNNNTFLQYVRDFDPNIKTMNDFQSNYYGSAENLDKLLNVARSIYEIPEGGSKKVEVPGLFNDKEIKRPFGIKNDHLDKFIADINALKILYNKQGGN